MKAIGIAVILLIIMGFNLPSVFAQTENTNSDSTAVGASSTLSLEKQLQTEQIEVAVGLDKVLELNFDFNTQMSLADASLLRVEPDVKRRKITLIGLKAGSTSLTVRDALWWVRGK